MLFWKEDYVFIMKVIYFCYCTIIIIQTKLYKKHSKIRENQNKDNYSHITHNYEVVLVGNKREKASIQVLL